MPYSTVQHVIKQSVLYSYAISQPFAVYVDAYPMIQNEQLLEQAPQFGQHNERVGILQRKLHKLSYFDDKIDDDFGILTEHAIKKFQDQHNMDVTGTANRITIHQLIRKEKEEQIEKLKDMSESIHPGMKSEDVKTVQESLQYFGYYTGDIDGIYGPLTQKALQVAENEHEINLTEDVSSSSLTALYETNKEEKVEQKTIKDTKETTEPITADVTGNNYANVVDAAYSLIGTPYVWGGESPDGFDCSGFIQYIFRTQEKVMPRTVSETWNFTVPVKHPSVGNLVFFETYQPGPSHMGIYVGDGKFIHAGTSRGVEVSKLSNSYWSSRYLGARVVK
ncbi:hypothetical protein GCM10009001_30580 [Virgibacillus siamensis]|uniref:NlpC/P60 domain-containing protein n=1 Tax=Virgibacillus siamensis TaxID=480071 RepID=A0ABN1GGQ7_9BACI